MKKSRKKEVELKNELNEKIEQLEQEKEKNTRLSEKVDTLEVKLKKTQDDEVSETVDATED